jgi:hypothetical protein
MSKGTQSLIVDEATSNIFDDNVESVEAQMLRTAEEADTPDEYEADDSPEPVHTNKNVCTVISDGVGHIGGGEIFATEQKVHHRKKHEVITPSVITDKFKDVLDPHPTHVKHHSVYHKGSTRP